MRFRKHREVAGTTEIYLNAYPKHKRILWFLHRARNSMVIQGRRRGGPGKSLGKETQFESQEEVGEESARLAPQSSDESFTVSSPDNGVARIVFDAACKMFVAMKAIGAATIFLLTFAFSGMATASVKGKCTNENEFPIIGILSQEVSNYTRSRNEESHSYIAASYVKFVEGAGARVVPIWIGKPRAYYKSIMAKINGILLPGGASYFDVHNGYADAACTIYDIAKQMNDAGNYFPIFGICLGFEVLIYAMAGRSDTARRECSDSDTKAPLAFEPGYNASKLFGTASETIIEWLQSKDLTYNQHIKCVTEQILKDHGIADQLRILSNNRDKKGLKFISAFESIRYPFYGLQFHPEKNLYEWKRTKRIPHGIYASRISQYFANFFVNEARTNCNEFLDKHEEEKSLIYNYKPTYTALQKSAFVQCYFFKEDYSGL